MPVHGFGYRGNWKEKVTDMRMNVLVAAIVAVSLVRLQAQNVQVRTYAVEGAKKTAENPVVVRPIQPLESSAFVGAQPLALSLIPSAETPDRTLDVALFRLNLLVGAHRRVSIFDLGVIGGISDDEMTGLGISGIFNRTGSSPGAFHLQSFRTGHERLPDFVCLELDGGTVQRSADGACQQIWPP